MNSMPRKAAKLAKIVLVLAKTSDLEKFKGLRNRILKVRQTTSNQDKEDTQQSNFSS